MRSAASSRNLLSATLGETVRGTKEVTSAPIRTAAATLPPLPSAPRAVRTSFSAVDALANAFYRVRDAIAGAFGVLGGLIGIAVGLGECREAREMAEGLLAYDKGNRRATDIQSGLPGELLFTWSNMRAV